MKKIPTIFLRDWADIKKPRMVIPKPNPLCQWVFDGEGVATRKLDGTCCMIHEGKLFKRLELRKESSAPEGFKPIDFDEETGKTVGWVPVGNGPEDRWHREALENTIGCTDGTYELIGPKVQGNPEKVNFHMLVKHGEGMARPFFEVPRTFEDLKSWLIGVNFEGVVFHHPDGRKAKIKLRDFGLPRKQGSFP